MMIKPYEEFPFEIGQEVYYISSRCKKDNYSASTLCGYNAKLRKYEGEVVAFVRSIDLMAMNLKDDGSFPLNEVFSTEEEVKAATEFFPVTFITSDDWEKAIGSNREGGVNTNDCELKPCCGNISSLGEYLYTCYSRSGLIKLDRDYVATLVLGHYDSYDSIPPILTNVFKQLKIEFEETE